MKNLIIFELKKICTRRITQIGIFAILALNFLLVISTFQSMHSFDGEGSEGTGMTAIAIDKQISRQYQGILTDEKVQQMLHKFKPAADLHGMNVKYLYQNALQSSVHARFSDLNGDWNGLTVSDVFGDEKIQIGYVSGWLHVSQYMIRIFIVLSLLMILMTAPVFSGEYGGVDRLILTAKYGKTQCSTAKNIAAILSALLITTLFVAVNIGAALTIYGREGLDCSILFAPMSFVEGYIPFNLTCKTLIRYQILLAFTCMISVTGITLLLSSLCKNQVVTLIASVFLFILPILLPLTEVNPLYRLAVLMPFYHAQFLSIMSVDQINGGLSYAVWSVPVAVFLMILGFIISRRAFANHQVL